jgi:GNAT superfamily N-acetyltransferase
MTQLLSIRRTDSDDPHFAGLVKLLDATLKELDGEEHAFYAQFNKSNSLKHVLVAYLDDEPFGCGAIREHSDGVMEIKRMYVLPGKRGYGIAKNILSALEDWSRELDCNTAVLETGKKQTEAIGLYSKMGYAVIPSYGQYKNVENSICFQKEL